MTHKEIIIKGFRQIEGIRKASKIVANTLKMIEAYIKPGVSTEELDHICNLYIKRNGGKSACIGYYQYPKYTCISLNDTICHGIPSKNEILKEGDILNIDVTVIVDGYFGDTSRMYTVGKIIPKAKTLVEVTKKCLEIGIKQVKPGNKTGNIGYEISKYAEAMGFSVVREYTGHGVGIHLHEEPYIFHKSNKNTGVIMKPGMIFTIEPMINVGDYKTKTLGDGWTVKTLDGSLSAQFEHTILVTEKGYEILTLPD
ncbi:MAG: type I methionyl aminopeptidase [Candidatus Gracilibacteria bacterium]|nr:type I methionyl aminopeptidase [Candidatus Gracilibacteria bacterium]MDD3120276.1 type I methionyl aminopeptidase [Candidatus Gracilibacteria bacterium]MDD4530171.1 type I methionyl aminopeptidase [Candidatus Gracilibacteria bacterium]